MLDYVQSADGLTLAKHGSAPLALLPKLTDRQTEVLLIVPAQALSWHQVQLPKGSLSRGLLAQQGANRLRSILEGLLEEQLLDDPAQLHLALQPQPRADAPVWVAACDRAWLASNVQALAQAGYAATRIVPEFTPESLGQTLYALGDEQQPVLVASMQSAAANTLLVCPLSSSALALLAAGPAAPAPRDWVAEPAVAALAEALLVGPVRLLQRPQRYLEATQTQWDLAQFDMQNSRSNRRWARALQFGRSLWQAPQWRPARWSLLALLLCNLIGLNVWAWREQSLLQAKQQAVRTLLTGTFPKVAVVVDAPLQMAREVAALARASGAASRTDFDAMLASFLALAPAGYALTAIDYAAQELLLKGPPSAAGELSRIVLALKQQGLSASYDGVQWRIKAGAAS
jgi:general secretion pathway protein L